MHARFEHGLPSTERLQTASERAIFLQNRHVEAFFRKHCAREKAS